MKNIQQQIKALDEKKAKLIEQLEKQQPKGKQYCIVRTYSAGVFAGYIKYRKDKEVLLIDARRIWYWDGAASLSELALKGTAKPDKCKFPIAVPEVILTEVIEIIPCSKKAEQSIKSVKEWKEHE